MIPFLVYLILKHRNTKILTIVALNISRYFNKRCHQVFTGIAVLILILHSLTSKSQLQQLNYKIMQGKDNIGWMKLEKNMTGNRVNLLLVSEITTRMIFRIAVYAKELSSYDNGKMIFSSQFRKTNGTTKLDKQTVLVSDRYEVLENGKKEKLPFGFIGTNLLSLYFKEPVGINAVYNDKNECFIKLSKTGDGGYLVKLSDGNSNSFYYSRNICTKVIVSSAFYTANIILTQ